MSGRGARAGAALCLAAASLGAGLAVAPVAAAAAAAAPTAAADPNAAALDNLASCVASRRRADLVLLLDQSASLQTTDPDGVRGAAAADLLTGLGEFADASQAAVDVRVAGFSVGYDPAGGWQRITPGTLGAVQDAVRAVAARDDGFETDYWAAIDGARADLRERARAAGTAPACQAVVWFTDGRFDLAARATAEEKERYGTTKPYAPGVELTDAAGAAAAEQAGTTSLCNDARQGPLNALRAGGVYLVAVGLDAPGRPADLSLLAAMARGSQGSTRCGTAPVPPTGAFLPADGIDQLVFAFDRVLGRTTTTTGPLAPGSSRSWPLVLDATVSRVSILAGADVDGVAVRLVAPGGGGATIPAASAGGSGRVVVGGFPLPYTWVGPRAVRLTLTRGDLPGWVGAWRLVFTAPASAPRSALTRASVRVSGDLQPGWTGRGGPVRAGESTRWTFSVVRPDGSVVPASDVKGAVRLDAALQLPDGTTRQLLAGATPAQLADPVAVDLSGAGPGQATLKLRLEVTTAPAGSVPGTRLSPQDAAFPVAVGTPARFPSVTTQRLDLPAIEGVQPATGALAVAGPGCVWLVSGRVDAVPDGVDAATTAVTTPQASSEASCLRLEEGATGTLPVTLAPAQEGNGSVEGVLVVGLAPADAGVRGVTVEVPFTGAMAKTPSTGTKLVLLLAALVLGLGLPPLFLLLLNHRAARIPPGRGGLQSGVLDLDVDGDEVRPAPGRPAALTPDTVAYQAVPDAGARTVSVDAGGVRVELGATVRANPLAAPVVLAAAADGRPLVSDAPPYQDSRGRAVLPLAVQNHWLVWRRPGSDGFGVLFLFAGATGEDERRGLVEDARARLPGLVSRLRAPAEVREPQVVGAGSDSGWTPLGPADAPPGAPPAAGPTGRDAPGWGPPTGPSAGPGSPPPPPGSGRW